MFLQPKRDIPYTLRNKVWQNKFGDPKVSEMIRIFKYVTCYLQKEENCKREKHSLCNIDSMAREKETAAGAGQVAGKVNYIGQRIYLSLIHI